MFKNFRYLLLLAICAVSSLVEAQTTTSSTYSQFGLGLLNRPLLPQTRAMGGISAAYRRPDAYNNINVANPAQYSTIRLTTFDGGLAAENLQRSMKGSSEKDFTGSLSHLAFGIPVTKTSAMSFGLLPYSSLGYQTRSRSRIDTSSVDNISSGDGGLSKVYLGYGIQINKNFSVGANASYIFGQLARTNSLEFVYDYSAYSTRQTTRSSYGGFTFDYGLQYTGALSKTVRLNLGYSGTSKGNLGSSENLTYARYTKSASGDEGVARDTVYRRDKENRNISLPLMHTFGFSLENTNHWMFGADLRLGQWGDFRDNKAKLGYMTNSQGFSVGGQITPDINSVGSYFKVIDYRLGFAYDKTNLYLNNTQVKQMAITMGLGLPLQSSITRTTFYKINLSAELGQRGSIDNNLVRERYINIHLGFTLNDTWFRKYKFD